MDPKNPGHRSMMNTQCDIDDAGRPMSDLNYTTNGQERETYHDHERDANYRLQLFYSDSPPWNSNVGRGMDHLQAWRAHNGSDFNHSPTTSEIAIQGSDDSANLDGDDELPKASKKSKDCKDPKKKKKKAKDSKDDGKKRSKGHSKKDRKDEDSSKKDERGPKGHGHMHGRMAAQAN